jgi:hypothetical protein
LVDKPDIVNVATDTNIYKRNYKIKQQPDLYHLDIRSDRQAAHHRYVHADQHQQWLTHGTMQCFGIQLFKDQIRRNIKKKIF